MVFLHIFMVTGKFLCVKYFNAIPAIEKTYGQQKEGRAAVEAAARPSFIL